MMLRRFFGMLLRMDVMTVRDKCMMGAYLMTPSFEVGRGFAMVLGRGLMVLRSRLMALCALMRRHVILLGSPISSLDGV
ncbi:hypothetical protein [Caulobacter sp. CCUG 60055]|uniref:hypothetical protein n=1 Tax=Caulobacter sp. CCUG 60055 TaxID=2100090 RepID=UPI001FA80A8C|nr:hypothetical protein [Caulobacter sp. CCUG 60055]